MSEYLAEAQILIRPNTAAFRARLLLELREIQASVPAVRIPVIAAGGAAAASGVAAANREVAAASAAASTAVNKQTVSERALSAAQVSATANASNLARAQLLNERATRALAAGETRALLTTSPLAAARARLAAANIAANTQERALAAALASGNAAAIAAITESETLARVRQAQAVATVEAAIAEQKLAASQVQTASRQGFARRGIIATGAEMAGLRGATLAANSAFIIGAAAALTFAAAIRGAAGLEEELNVFKVTARATADEMARVSDEAVRLGADISLPGVSSRDAAEAMTELSKAGLDVRDSLSGARGVLSLAAAAQISNAEATDLAATALNTFSLSGGEALHVADLLAIASNEAQGSISEMGLALKQSASVSRLAGISLEDTIAILTLLAKNGLRGSDAGTAFRTSLLRLINPTEKANTIIKQLGISLRDTAGNIRPDVYAQFATATANLGREQQDAAAAIVFGQDAIRAQAILGRENIAGLKEQTVAQERMGAVTELAGARSQGFTGQMNALKSNLETLGTTLGGALLPSLKLFLGNLNEIVTAANNAALGVRVFAESVSTLNSAATGVIPGLGALEGKLIAIGKIQLLGPFGLAARGVNLLADQFKDAGDDIESDAKVITKGIEQIFASIEGPTGSTQLNTAVVALSEMADKLAAGDAEARKVSKELKAIVAETQNLNALPASVIELTARLDRAGLKSEGQEGGKIVLDALTGILSPEAGHALGFPFIEGAVGGMKDAVDQILIPEVPKSLAQITRRFEEDLLDAQIANNRQQELATLRAEEADIAAQLARGVKKYDKRIELKAAQDANQDKIKTIEDEIAADAKSAADKRKSDATSAAADIKTAIREADQALLDSLDVGQDAARNAALIAAGTETLNDDIKAQARLKAIILKQVETGKGKIKDRKVLAEFLRAQNRELLEISLKIASLKEQAVLVAVNKRVSAAQDRAENAEITESLNDDIRAQINLRKTVTQAIARLQAEGASSVAAVKDFIEKRKAIKQKIADLRQEQRAERLEGLGLNVEFAEITGNRSAEVKAREAEIRAIREQMSHEKKTSNEYKRLRNELAAKQKELAELKKQKDKTANAFNELTFSFLQTQQGFAANLLGNLLDPGATAGILGGTASPSGGGPSAIPAINLTSGIDPATGRPFRESGGPGEGLARQSTEKDIAPSGPTRGGQATEIDILRQILRVLQDVKVGTGHPEAKFNKMTTREALNLLGD